MLFLVFVLFHIHISWGDICGIAPVGNCLQSCYADCITKLEDVRDQAQVVSDPELEEEIATDNYICYGKCRGSVTVPNNAPNYGYNPEFDQCVGSCGHPINPDCTKGYLAKFLYCDCYKCCEKTAKQKDSSCSAACFDSFLKPDGPEGVEVCRFRRAEYTHTPHTWCSAYCTWKLLKFNSLPITDVSTIANKITLCTSRCAAFMEVGEYWDYEAKLSSEHCILEPLRCMSSVKITKLIITKGITDADITAAPKETVKNNRHLYQDDSITGPPQIPNYQSSRTFEKNYTFYKSVTVKWPAAFKNMLKDGFVLTCEPTVEIVSQFPTPATKIDWDEVNRYLISAFNADKSNARDSRKVTHERHVTLSKGIKVHSCERYLYYGVETKPKGLSIALEIHAEISELKQNELASKDELKKSLQDKWSGLEYVADLSGSGIAVKGTATAAIAFGMDATIQGDCIPSTVRDSDTGQSFCQDPAYDFSTGCVCTQNC